MAIEDYSDRHNLYLQKLGAGIYNSKVYPSLEEARKAVRLLLLDAEELKTVSQVKKLNSEIRKAVDDIYSQGWAAATEDLEQVAEYEASWQVKAISAYSASELREPAKKQIQRFINQSVMSLASGKRVNAGTWADFVGANTDSVKRQYNSLVIQGYQDGLTVNQIAKQIKDSTDGILAQEAETLARTGLSHYANAGRDAMAAANSDIIKFRVFSATFDNRTTLQCRGFDGRSWAYSDDTYPRIPLHYGCRSSYYFVTDESEIGQGRKAAVGGKTDGSDINPRRKLRYRGKKDSDIFKPGQIDAASSQDAWLRKQPRWFIESTLGETRTRLFLDGKMPITRFTDMQGKTINLDQLKELDADAFKRAGL